MILPLHPEADRELDRAVEWTATHHGPARAERLNDALREAVRSAAAAPERTRSPRTRRTAWKPATSS